MMTVGKRDRASPLMRRKAACRLNAQRSCLMTAGINSNQVAELGEDGAVERAFEVDDVAQQFGCREPAPVGEFGDVGIQPNVAVAAGEARGEPLLALGAMEGL